MTSPAGPKSPNRAAQATEPKPRIDPTWAWPGLVLALGAFAYRPLLAQAFELPSAYQLERWLFRPSQLPLLFVVGVAGWLTWRRRGRLRAQPGSPGRHAPGRLAAAGGLAALGAALFAWALLTRASDLLLPSLAALLLALGAAARGPAGWRSFGLPAVVLLLGVPLPAPLRHEIVWRLQLAAASGAAWLVDLAGLEFVHSGVILRSADQTFHVIDGCSGLQGMEILLVAALIVRELFASGGRRQWLLLPAALALGYILNALRVALIAAASEPEALLETGTSQAGGHTLQGLAVLAAGTAALYLLGGALARRGPHPPEPRPEPAPADPGSRAPWPAAAAALAALCLLSLVVSPFKLSPAAAPEAIWFPTGGSGWVSQALGSDPYFLGRFGAGQTLYRLYERPDDAPRPRRVELFIVSEHPQPPDAGPLFSSKPSWPGADWDLVSRRATRVPGLERDGELAVAAQGSGSERAVVYTWRLHDRGLWSESWRALLALDSSPWRRREARRLVRLVAFAVEEHTLAVDQAKRRLDRFVEEFQEEFAAL